MLEINLYLWEQEPPSSLALKLQEPFPPLAFWPPELQHFGKLSKMSQHKNIKGGYKIKDHTDTIPLNTQELF